MTRYRLGYAPPYSADNDAGGAADLQTDIMRFMAILSLCLVAIFALVQSIPLTPTAAEEVPVSAPQPIVAPAAELEKPVIKPTQPKHVVATPMTAAQQAKEASTAPPIATTPPAETVPVSAPAEAPAVFTLRFASDIALTRLVAQQKVGLYAISEQRALRLAISNSKASFWNASMPGSFHEMDANTVPRSVLDALARAETTASDVRWGVTLPNQLGNKLERLMQTNGGGSLVIGSDGDIALEAQ